MNKIENVCDEIGYLKNLGSLWLFSNKISSLNPCVGQLISLDKLHISDNNLVEIPDEIFNLTNLKILNLINNKIERISNDIHKLVNLEFLNMSSNKLKELPISIILCRNLKMLRYDNNEIDYIPPQILRFLYNRNNNYFTDIQVYNDNQNIHNHSIQSSVSNSISKIMSKPLINSEEHIISQILSDSILTLKTKELLIEYSNDTDYHSVLLITFKELLMYVWQIIEENKNKDEIKKILNIEILDSECKCFTGRLSRLVNCLNGFSDLVEIRICDNQQIGNIIVMIGNELQSKRSYTIEEHKRRVMEELKMRNYDDKIIEEWIEQIE
jgi:hypothetical protein